MQRCLKTPKFPFLEDQQALNLVFFFLLKALNQKFFLQGFEASGFIQGFWISEL